MKFVAGLTCHLCGATYPAEASWVCAECLGPLEVSYDYAAIRSVISRAVIESRPRSLWRYLELLPVEEPRTGFHSGFTPVVRATRLARELGVPPRRINEIILGKRGITADTAHLASAWIKLDNVVPTVAGEGCRISVTYEDGLGASLGLHASGYRSGTMDWTEIRRAPPRAPVGTTRIRYQLKLSRPWPLRASSWAAGTTAHAESSKSRAPAWGLMS